MNRKYFVIGEVCSPAQGKMVHQLILRMFTRRDSTETDSKIYLDPVRKEWNKFIAEVCLGKLVNPKIPRQTGSDVVNIFYDCHISHISTMQGSQIKIYCSELN
jgi:hypothetical protein